MDPDYPADRARLRRVRENSTLLLADTRTAGWASSRPDGAPPPLARFRAWGAAPR